MGDGVGERWREGGREREREDARGCERRGDGVGGGK